MTIEQVIKLILEQGGVLGLCFFSLWMLDKVWKLRLEEAQKHYSDINALRASVQKALISNTEAIARLTQKLSE